MADNAFQKSSITLEAAERMLKAADAKAGEMKIPMVIAVCDGDGNGLVALRGKIRRPRYPAGR